MTIPSPRSLQFSPENPALLPPSVQQPRSFALWSGGTSTWSNSSQLTSCPYLSVIWEDRWSSECSSFLSRSVLLDIVNVAAGISVAHSGLNFQRGEKQNYFLEENSNVEKKSWEFPYVWNGNILLSIGQFSRNSFCLWLEVSAIRRF